MRRILAILGALLVSAPALGQSIQLPAGQILGNSTAAQRPAQASTVTSILDRAMGSTPGSIMVRGASTWAVSPVINIGAGPGGINTAFPNNFNVYTAQNSNSFNGISLTYGTGNGQGEGGGISFITKNIDGSAVHAFQEMGFSQAYWCVTACNTGSPTYNIANTPLAIVFGTTEAQSATNQGSGVIWQIKTRGEANARGELSLAEGLTASINATQIQIGLGRGTINAEAGLYDNSNRALSASNLNVTKNQNANTNLQIQNSTNGTGASASIQVTSDVASAQVGASATLNSLPLFAGRSWLFANSPLLIGASGAASSVIFAPNSVQAGQFLTGLAVGPAGTADPGAGVVNVSTGIRVANAATIGNVLRGNGTNFVSAQLAAADLSGIAAGCVTFLGTPSSANLRGCISDETGTGLAYFQGGDIGTPSAGVGTNLTALNATNLGSGTVPFARLPTPATLQAAPANPTGTTSGVGVMMGLGSTCTITPNFSGRVEVTWRYGVGNTGTTGSVTTGARFGTGTAPINGAALTGTAIGQAFPVGIPATSTLYGSSGAGGVVTGLTPGTPYWLDMQVAAVSGTAVIQSIGCTAEEF